MSDSKPLVPLIYSCSGCSSAAQTANEAALRLDRAGVVQMSCIAGVGGDVTALLRIAQSGRDIVALDGCALQCVKNCLKRHQLTPTTHLNLSEYGVKKRNKVSYDAQDVERVMNQVALQLGVAIPREPSRTYSIRKLFRKAKTVTPVSAAVS